MLTFLRRAWVRMGRNTLGSTLRMVSIFDSPSTGMPASMHTVGTPSMAAASMVFLAWA